MFLILALQRLSLTLGVWHTALLMLQMPSSESTCVWIQQLGGGGVREVVSEWGDAAEDNQIWTPCLSIRDRQCQTVQMDILGFRDRRGYGGALLRGFTEGVY